MYRAKYLPPESKRGHRRGQAALLWAGLVVGLIVCMAFTAGAQTGGTQEEAAPSQLTVTINSHGMTPSSATVSSGMLHLKVENRGNSDHLTLRVSRSGGEVMREINVTDKGQEVAMELMLSPGQYTISEANNQSLSCQITAQTPPKKQGAEETGPVWE